MPEVTLSDGKPFTVRTLGIFELDKIDRPNVGPFLYPMQMLGDVIKWAEFKFEQYEETGTPLPEKPDMPEHEIQEGSAEWYELRDWNRRQAAEWHEKERDEAVAGFGEAVLAYLFDNCMERDELNRIVTESDFKEILFAAVVPALTMTLIVDTMRNTYRAKFSNQDIFEALDKAETGHGEYNVLRHWENKWANIMGFTDAQLATVPVEERARRVCSMLIEGWMEYLEVDRVKRKTPDLFNNAPS